ncbi:winged helix-turn-helix domain-containing protein [Arcobacter sp. KX21116]|jgi:two-component system KDP operon response regulator KdpE|uniref:winged helix-turn-helix domain-containing protein n=1 Tax=Arcobacter iocasae TaxID=2906515 RepID=UPI0035D40CAE|tara:strand:- start:10726 stop:11415 length:690 start_codon:yes stop_codon:yes gene_type:complete
MKELIHIIEDDSSVKRLLEITFKEYAFNFISSESKKNAIMMFLSHNPSLLIVDLGLPDGDGKDLIKQIREISKVPIIVLTARHDEKEIVAALDVGADDYITKPFSVNELLARIRANLRRNIAKEEIDNKFICNDLELDISSRTIKFKQEVLKLTPIEYELLKYFMINANKTLTHKQILNEVWGTGYQTEMQYLRTYVNTLRKKIEQNSTRPKYIKTESGVGYRFSYSEN